jgi:hypothetical protein
MDLNGHMPTEGDFAAVATLAGARKRDGVGGAKRSAARTLNVSQAMFSRPGA